jgi:hypothetical protein
MKFKVTPLSSEKENMLYGTRKIEIGKCFKTQDGKFYRQYRNHVLQVNVKYGHLVNSLAEGYLNKRTDEYVEITENEFNNKVKEVIYTLELDTFWKQPKKD